MARPSLCEMSLLLTVFAAVAMSSPGEEKLINYLFKERQYQKIARPVRKSDDVAAVQLTVSVSKIFEVNEQKELLTASLEFYLMWRDYRLSWDPSQYENVTGLQIPASELWLPTILLTNNARDEGGRLGLQDNLSRHLVKVKPRGICSWYISSILTTNCPVNVRYFPFDKQRCSLQFEQFEPMSEVEMIFNSKANISGVEYVDDGVWTLYDSDYEESIANNRYSRIRVDLYLNRKSFYYVVNFVIPCFAFSIISLVTFLIRPDSGERMGVSISLLLGLIVYQMIINDKLPETSDSVPLLGVYIEFIIVTFIMSSIMFILVMYLSHTEPHLPKWLRHFLCVHLVRLMCIKQPSARNKTPLSDYSAGKEDVRSSSTKIDSPDADIHTAGHRNCVTSNDKTPADSQDDSSLSGQMTTVFCQKGVLSTPRICQQEDVLHDILLVLRNIDAKLDTTGFQMATRRREQQESVMSPDWLVATWAIDRLFFCICCACCLLCNLFFAITWLVISHT